MTAPEILRALRTRANPANVAGMARYGINPRGTLGVPVVELRRLAHQIGRDHSLALDLWSSGIHEARILATIVDDPALVTPRQMHVWARDFDSWDVCDQACQNLFRYTPHAWPMAVKWSTAKPEFVRRAAFALMAGLAIKDKQSPNARFESVLPLIANAAGDDRNLVKKSVNWALRQIGKRNPTLRRAAIAAARQIHAQDTPTARWIANDAVRELTRHFDAVARRRRVNP